MFPLLALTLPNIQIGHLQPPEDAYKYLSSDAVVADGVTREPLPIRDRRKLTFEQATKGYP
ncbi:hypothetical protein KKC47_00660, partial [Patescibacteria group bacterium]|nr:hypothetical protein [Patescibacteria group bacterium]